MAILTTQEVEQLLLLLLFGDVARILLAKRVALLLLGFPSIH